MLNKLSYRWAIIVIVLLMGTLWTLPNFYKFDKKSVFGKTRIIPGLDIQGGLHLVMGVDVQEVVVERVSRMVKNLTNEFKENGVPFQAVNITGADKTQIEIVTAGGASKDAIEKYLQDKYPSTLQVVTATADKVEVHYFDAVLLDMKKQIVNQAIEVIRNRIDEFGVSEPSISAQGYDRILVQLPGIQDAARAKELINRTARLDFRVVSPDVPLDKLTAMITDAEKKGNFQLGDSDTPKIEGVAAAKTADNKDAKAGGPDKLMYQAYIKRLNEALAPQLPKDTRIVFEKFENAESLAAGRRPYLVKTDSHLTGAQLEDASVHQDEYNRPEVNFRFTIEGRKLFAELTTKAAGGQLAIVLDDVVKSAPSVQKEIDSDSARITLGGGRDYNTMFNEAQFIATSLRAGALPAALVPMEERTVGPSLGSDSIKKAQMASMIAALLVFAWMLIYYRTAGLIADVSLVINVFLTFAVLTSLGATLTLPGVAGIALVIGMAVDANVIVYERIKEELRKGSSGLNAIREGFHHAFTSIFDANMTTVLTCLVLMYYGTGPVRGFAVSLAIGMVTSMFTAIFFSRTVLDTLVGKFGMTLFTVAETKPAANN